MDLSANKKIVANQERLKLIGLKVKKLAFKVKYQVYREEKKILRMYIMLEGKLY